VRRAGTVLAALAVLGALAGCTHNPKTASTTTTHPKPGSPENPIAPTESAVVSGSYATSVEIGRHVLEVSPPPKDADPSVSLAQAKTLFDAYQSFGGIYEFTLLGLGTATLDEEDAIQIPATTTTTTTTTETSTTETSTTETSSDTGTSGVVPPVTTPTTAPPTTTTTAPPYYEHLAYVGIAVGQVPDCAEGTPSVIAMLIDADTGGDIYTVTSGGCTTDSATVDSAPRELESVRWSPVGPASTAVNVQIPACGTYVGWTAIGSDVEVEAAVPYDPQCGATAPTTQAINLVVPLGSTGTSPPHAALGPIDNLNVL